MKRDPHSVFDEPWLQPPGREGSSPAPAGKPDAHATPDDYSGAGEIRPGQSELENVLHSVHSEPGAEEREVETETELAHLIAQKRAGMSPVALAGTVLLTALLAGPISVVGTMAAGNQGFFGSLYLVAGGPVIEEMMKLGGLLFLLEKKPWSIIKGWHIIAAACISAALFGIIENLVYGGVYLSALSEPVRDELMRFRWTVTPLMHMGATVIGAIGLRKAWLATVAKGRLFDSQVAEPYIAAAVAVHGGYNALALLFGRYMVEVRI